MKKSYQQPKLISRGYLQVSQLHKIYYEESGNPQGQPVIHLHGGPGSRSKPKHKKYFNPKKYHLITFDQRGCGRSTPRGELKENNTLNLIEDIEKLRHHFKIKKWLVFGGSWGSTLALAYAEKYPSSVSHIFITSIFLARQKDMDWIFYGQSIKNILPDLWQWRQAAQKKLGLKNDHNLYKQIYKILTAGKLTDKKLATLAFFDNWEGQFFAVNQEIDLKGIKDVQKEDIKDATIFMHYAVNNFWLKENQLLNKINRLPRVPIVIIHGRYDIDCPLIQAWELSQAIGKKKHTFEIIPAAGHHMSAKGLDRIIFHTNRLIKKKNG